MVAYRTLPGDAFNCLIIPTESLPDSYHDALVSLVESNAAQSAFEFYEVLDRSTFPDGSRMLVSLHAKGFLVKVPTDDVEMIPNHQTSIRLSELNHLIAQQRGVSVQDLSVTQEPQSPDIREVAQVNDITPKSTSTDPIMDQPLSDEQLADKYRNDAARLLKEVEHLQKMAEELVPSKQVNNTISLPEVKTVEVKSAETKPVAAKKPTPARKRSTTTK
jgi:hypothetical protein